MKYFYTLLCSDIYKRSVIFLCLGSCGGIMVCALAYRSNEPHLSPGLGNALCSWATRTRYSYSASLHPVVKMMACSLHSPSPPKIILYHVNSKEKNYPLPSKFGKPKTMPISLLSWYSIGLLCGRSRVQNPGRTNTQGLKITENVLPLWWHLQMVRCSSK